jgi:hypothetical protein
MSFKNIIVILVFLNYNNICAQELEKINLAPDEPLMEIQFKTPKDWNITGKDKSIEDSGIVFETILEPRNANNEYTELIQIQIYRLKKLYASQKAIIKAREEWSNDTNKKNQLNKKTKNREIVELKTFEKYKAIIEDFDKTQNIGLGMGIYMKGKIMMVMTDYYLIGISCSVGGSNLGILDPKSIGNDNLYAQKLEKICFQLFNSLRYVQKNNNENSNLESKYDKNTNSSKLIFQDDKSDKIEQINSVVIPNKRNLNKYITLGFTGGEKSNGQSIYLYDLEIETTKTTNLDNFTANFWNSNIAENVKNEISLKYNLNENQIKIKGNTILIIYNENNKLDLSKINFNNSNNKNINISINAPSGIINGINYGENPFKEFVK